MGLVHGDWSVSPKEQIKSVTANRSSVVMNIEVIACDNRQRRAGWAGKPVQRSVILIHWSPRQGAANMAAGLEVALVRSSTPPLLAADRPRS